MAWTTPKTWAFQEGVESSELNIHLRDNELFLFGARARKSGDQSISSNTSLQNATDMSFSIGASETWGVELWAAFTVPGTPDLKIHWNTPSGATGHHLAIGDSVSGRATLANDIIIGGTGGVMSMVLFATIINSTNPGSVQFQFAQFASDASAVIMHDNATIVAHRIA